MISTSNIEQAKKEIARLRQASGASLRKQDARTHPISLQKLPGSSGEKHPIIIESQTPEFDRAILEYGKFQVLLSPEKNGKKDKPKQLDSGLNHVLANISEKNNVSIGINLEEISKLDKKSKAIRLARIKQNIKILRKSKTKLAILYNSDKKNAVNLLLSLGASTQQTKETITF